MGFKGLEKGLRLRPSRQRIARPKSDGSRAAKRQIFVRGPGAGRESALRALQSAGFNISLIKDVTPIPHNGAARRTKAGLIRRKGLARSQNLCAGCREKTSSSSERGAMLHDKCAIERRNYPPAAWPKRPKFSEYSIQLREKQKVKRMYGLLENQFRRTFARASREKGITGEALLVLLERRLDNVPIAWFCPVPERKADCWFGRGIFWLMGKRVNIPSYVVRVGDELLSKRIVGRWRES